MIEQIILLVDKNLEIADILIALVAFIVSIVALVYTKITDAMILEHHVKTGKSLVKCYIVLTGNPNL